MNNAIASEFRDYLTYISVERGLSRNTSYAYQRDLSKFSQYLNSLERSVADVKVEDLVNFSAYLRSQELSESSIARCVVGVRNFYLFYSRERKIINPAKDFHPPRIPKRLPKALSVAQISLLMDSAEIEGELLSLRDRALIEILYSTGARVSEIVDLTLADLATIENSMSVRLTGKGNKQRVVPIGTFAKRALEQYLVRLRPTLAGKGRSDALFLNQRGGKLTRQSAWQLISNIATRSGLEEVVSPHALRHSFATHLLDGGADIRVVQELLGHASVTTTQIYTLVTIDKLRESYSSAHPRAR